MPANGISKYMHEHAFTGHKNNAPLYRREPNTVRFATISILSTLQGFRVTPQEPLSWAAFDSPAPSSVIIFIVLGIAWLAFTQGWCFMAGAAFRSTYKRAYIGNVILNILLIAAVVMWAIVAFQ